MVRDNLARLRDLIGKRGLLLVRSADGYFAEVPITFIAVAPPRRIPEQTDFDTFTALISQSEFLVRFDDGRLLDGRNTRRVSGFYVLPESKALRAAFEQHPVPVPARPVQVAETPLRQPQ